MKKLEPIHHALKDNCKSALEFNQACRNIKHNCTEVDPTMSLSVIMENDEEEWFLQYQSIRIMKYGQYYVIWDIKGDAVEAYITTKPWDIN